jgi:hypothetical protein
MSHVFVVTAQSFGDSAGLIFFPLVFVGVLILAWVYGKIGRSRDRKSIRGGDGSSHPADGGSPGHGADDSNDEGPGVGGGDP